MADPPRTDKILNDGGDVNDITRWLGAVRRDALTQFAEGNLSVFAFFFLFPCVIHQCWTSSEFWF